MASSPPIAAKPDFPMRHTEFVAVIAALMSLTALGIDTMLPALGAISDDYQLANPNDRQWVVTVFLAGFGLGALLLGPFCDRFGRRKILILSLIGYILAAGLTIWADSFTMLLVLRVIAGFCSGGIRIVVTAIIRDRYEGDAMARIVSLAYMIFMLVPMVAPFLGYSILHASNWHWIFAMMAICGALTLAWCALRMPETMTREKIVFFRFSQLIGVWRQVIFNRSASAYVVAVGIISAPLFGFIGASQQIFDTTFGEPAVFPLVFAGVASALAVSAYTNAHFVERFGARPIAHLAIILTLVTGTIMVVMLLLNGENLVRFSILLALALGLSGFVGSNCSSIAMQPFGASAGSASSFQAFVTTLLSAGLGGLVGQYFDGSTLPLSLSVVVAGILALGLVLWAENGKILRRKQRGTESI